MIWLIGNDSYDSNIFIKSAIIASSSVRTFINVPSTSKALDLKAETVHDVPMNVKWIKDNQPLDDLLHRWALRINNVITWLRNKYHSEMHEVQKDRQIKTISMLNLGQGKSICCSGPMRTTPDNSYRAIACELLKRGASFGWSFRPISAEGTGQYRDNGPSARRMLGRQPTVTNH